MWSETDIEGAHPTKPLPLKTACITERMLALMLEDRERVWSAKQLHEELPDAKLSSIHVMLNLLCKQGRVLRARYGRFKACPGHQQTRKAGRPKKPQAKAPVVKESKDAAYLRQLIERTAIAAIIDMGIGDEHLQRQQRWIKIAFDRGRESVANSYDTGALCHPRDNGKISHPCGIRVPSSYHA
jgi:hypothetical protein